MNDKQMQATSKKNNEATPSKPVDFKVPSSESRSFPKKHSQSGGPQQQVKKKKKDFFAKSYKSEYEEKVIKTKRISKTTKGGRQGRIWVLVVIGNRKGQVGFGVGKSKEFPDAAKKAVKNALKNVFNIKMNDKGTLYHEVLGKHGSSKVLIKSAKVGTGIIAGGVIKTVLELAGFNDVYSKNLGSNVALNMARATIHALLQQRSPEEIAALRDREVKDLFR